MKYHIISVLILTLYACIDTHDKSQNVLSNFKFPTNYSQKQVVSNEFPSKENAHPNAKRLMNEDFYWSPIDESAPFGSDDGADTYNGFATWRQRNKTEKPMVFFIAQINSWGYPTFDFNETSFDKLEPYLRQTELGSRFMSGIDAAIVSIAFGQLYLEGTIDDDFKELAKTTILRQLIPEMLNFWDDTYKHTRESQLKVMLEDLKQVS